MPYRDDRIAWKTRMERLERDLADARLNAEAAEREKRRLAYELEVLRARWSPGHAVIPRAIAIVLVLGAAAIIASALALRSRTHGTVLRALPKPTSLTPIPIGPISAPLPLAPTRAEIQAAMGAVAGAVRACAGGVSGTATIRMTLSGSGHVTSAAVIGPPFARTPAGACMARAVRSATLPGFDRPSFSLTYPFVVR